MLSEKLDQRAMLCALILMCMLCYPVAKAQKSAESKQQATGEEVLESFTSSKVLNILMPKVIELNGEFGTALSVRVEPSFEEEFQYIFLKNKSDAVEVIKRRSADGNIDSRVLNLELATKKKVTPVDIAKQIRVDKTRTSISAAKFNELLKSLDAAMRDQDSWEVREKIRQQNTLSADGTRYVIWMAGDRQYDVAVHGRIYKSPPREDESPLITWVRHLVNEL
jgi:hypothetical protein